MYSEPLLTDLGLLKLEQLAPVSNDIPAQRVTRYIAAEERYTHTRRESTVLGGLALVAAQGFLLPTITLCDTKGRFIKNNSKFLVLASLICTADFVENVKAAAQIVISKS